MEEISDKPKDECFEIMANQMQKDQLGLAAENKTDLTRRDLLILACSNVAACHHAIFKPSENFEAVCSDLRHSIHNLCKSQATHQSPTYLNTTSVVIRVRMKKVKPSSQIAILLVHPVVVEIIIVYDLNGKRNVSSANERGAGPRNTPKKSAMNRMINSRNI